jgi:Uma2 family endonuclease
MGAATQKLTIEQYRQLPRPADGSFYELHHGEVVRATRPKKRHSEIQYRLARQLESTAGERWTVRIEMPYVVDEGNLRAADIGVVAAARYQATDDDDNLHGAPELVVEVMSPSNTARESDDREALSLAHGCVEFWVVNPELKTVRVTAASGIVRYTAEQTMGCSLFPEWKLAVSEIFV